MKLYVVTAPESIRGIYDTWPACQAAVSGVRGARHQSVTSRPEAKAILRGESVTLPPGLYAFTDGNHLGGVGVVWVTKRRAGAPRVKEISTSVAVVFAGSAIPGLTSPQAIADALARIRNVLAELAGLYHVVATAAPRPALTLVHDYEGIGAWMEGRWRARDAAVAAIIGACQRTVVRRRLTLTFHHQKGHQSSYVSGNEFALYHARADALATRGGAQ